MEHTSAPTPKIVSKEEWQAAHEQLLVKEKEATKARDALNASRRKLPMYEVEQEYIFQGVHGTKNLLELFEGRRQLLMYNFMFDPEWTEGCVGCSMMVDNMCHPAHLAARDITLVLVSRAPLTVLEPFRKRMGWSLPWYSSYENSFNQDFEVSTPHGENFRLSVFFQNQAKVYHSYFTKGRGVEHLGSSFSFMDLTPYGRQEDWEDSPAGWPKGPRYEWWKLHDSYGSKIYTIKKND
ncbi:MAG: DUF899 domain-containing protein [Bdellovibrionales bacterium]|nr:DUF899 domain-containing protein [Bdellovibrionales bacterium]